MGCESEDSRARNLSEGLIQRLVDSDVCKIVIVQSSAAQILFLEIETQGPGQVESSACASTHPNGITRIWWDDGTFEDDVGVGLHDSRGYSARRTWNNGEHDCSKT